MKFFKPTIYFFLYFMILSLSGGLAYANHNNGKMKQRGMDRNKDGVVTRGEWRGNTRAFNNHDWNGDGVLSGDEMRYGAWSVGEVDSFRALDWNNNGVVSMNEWTGTLRSFEGLDLNQDGRITRYEFYNRQQYPVSVFRELDQNNNGRISRSEWRRSIVSFNRLDTNGDNVLSEYEFNGRRGGGIVDQIFYDIFGGR